MKFAKTFQSARQYRQKVSFRSRPLNNDFCCWVPQPVSALTACSSATCIPPPALHPYVSSWCFKCCFCNFSSDGKETLRVVEMVNRDTKVLIYVLMQWLLWIRLAHYDLSLTASTGGQTCRGSQELTHMHTCTPFFLLRHLNGVSLVRCLRLVSRCFLIPSHKCLVCGENMCGSHPGVDQVDK